MMSSSIIILSGIILAATATAVAGQAKPGCTSYCGDLHIPYPFGTSDGCYRDENFLISCHATSGKPIANYSTSATQVLNISLHGELRVAGWVSWDCYDSSANRFWNFIWIQLSKFVISNTKNMFIVLGCDTYAFIVDFWGRRFATGCSSVCGSVTDVVNGTCSGIGCCQTSFPKGNMGYNISISSYSNHSQVLDFNPCSYAFVVENGAYNFSSVDLKDLQNERDFPLIIDWAIGNETCADAMKNTSSYACMENSICVDSENAPGYRCQCKDGFQGNPYLSGSDGCQDIDECSISSPCNNTCHNLLGSYNCSCPPGYKGDGFKNGTGCVSEDKSNDLPVIEISLGISVGLLALGIFIISLCWVQRKRKLINIKKKFFEQNGGIMLQEQLSERQGYNEMAKLFSEDELKKATDNFHESKILGRGGQGTVYEGILPDNRVVAIKKSRITDHSQVKDFINEMLVLSQINHRNVVKILGCCLETEVPLLVYEFVPNSTLLYHLDPSEKTSCIPWETRLRIAAETAGAISYLHSAASIPIIHRDIKSSNILLDHNNTAKVSDFGASRLVPADQTQITTLVQGTLGYLDPEYLQTSQLTEKSDVYSFGVVLVELLTGKKVVEFNRPEEERNLAMYFVSSMRKDRLLEVLDSRVLNEKNVWQLKEVAVLAMRCIRVKGEERPTMKEVSMELDGLIAMEKHPWDAGDMNSEENEYLLGQMYGTGSNMVFTGSTSNSVGFESTGNQLAFEMESGR